MKTAIITGASRGIGLETAKVFLSHGWRVIGSYLLKPSDYSHSEFVQLPMDLSKPESITQFVSGVRSRTKRVDALINNAAVLLDYGSPVAVAALVRRTLEVNVVGTVDLTEQLIADMHPGSHIVNIDSNIGSFAHPVEEDSAVGYRLSKAALNMYTRTLARRIAPEGVLVSSLDPGWVDTDMGRAGGDVPDRRPGEPASEVYKLVADITDIKQTGKFWRFGLERPW